mgnify:CR=1 FL=1
MLCAMVLLLVLVLVLCTEYSSTKVRCTYIPGRGKSPWKLTRDQYPFHPPSEVIQREDLGPYCPSCCSYYRKLHEVFDTRHTLV